MRGERVVDRARHRAERRLVQHEVDAAAGLRGRPSGSRDVAFDEPVPRPGLAADRVAHLVEVVAVAGREVVEADDALPERAAAPRAGASR